MIQKPEASHLEQLSNTGFNKKNEALTARHDGVAGAESLHQNPLGFSMSHLSMCSGTLGYHTTRLC